MQCLKVISLLNAHTHFSIGLNLNKYLKFGDLIKQTVTIKFFDIFNCLKEYNVPHHISLMSVVLIV